MLFQAVRHELSLVPNNVNHGVDIADLPILLLYYGHAQVNMGSVFLGNFAARSISLGPFFPISPQIAVSNKYFAAMFSPFSL